jgi:hypothetical protein
MVPETGPKVLPTSATCSGVRQRAFACGGAAAPFMTVFEVTFHCPGSIRLSAAAEVANTGSEQSNIIPNLVIRPSFQRPCSYGATTEM